MRLATGASRLLLGLLLCAALPCTSSRRELTSRGGGSSAGPGVSRRPLILFYDDFFGRDFVKEDYAFEVRPRAAYVRAACVRVQAG